MKRNHAVAALVVAALLCTQALAAGPLDELVQRLPADTPAEAADVYQQILKGGAASITTLVGMLKPPEVSGDSKARFALHGLAIHACREGAESERMLLATTLAKLLDSDMDPHVKGFLVRQLQLAGRSESIEPIAKLLTDEFQCEYAAQALLAMKDPAVIPHLKRAVEQAGPACRMTLVQALGVLKEAKGVAAAQKGLADKNREMRLVSAFALANSADAAAADTLLKGAASDSPYEASQMMDASLLLARRLGEAGEKKAAERICRRFLVKDASLHARCSALVALASALGAEAMDDVLAAMNSKETDYQAAGIEAAIAMPGEKATQRWVDRMKDANPEGRVAILDLLGRRGDPAALPAIIATMKDPDEKVRVAAIRTAGMAASTEAVAPLAELVISKSPIEATAARNALQRIPGEAASAAIVAELQKVDPKVRAELLRVLAVRQAKEHFAAILRYASDADKGVQAAAVDALGRLAETNQLPVLAKLLIGADSTSVGKAAENALTATCARSGDKATCVKALTGELQAAKGAARVSLYRVLGTIGTKEAFQVVRSGLDDADADVQDAAIRGLSDWPDDSPTADLLKIAKASAKPTHQVLALRGYVRMIGVKSRPPAEGLAMCNEAFAAAKRDDERRAILSALSSVGSPEALKLAQSHLGNKALVNEAAIAMIRIARVVSGQDRDAARKAIEAAMAATDAGGVQNEGKAAIAFLERAEDFITSWLVSGPYKGSSVKSVHPPEQPDAKDVKWKLVTAAGDQPGFVDFNKEVSQQGDQSAYMKCQIYSPKAQKALLETGSDDGIKIWLNGKVVLEKDVPRSLTIGEDKTIVDLQEGWNALLIQVGQGGGDWSGIARLRAADGGKLTGWKTKVE